MLQLSRRDFGDNSIGYGPPIFLLTALLLFTCSAIATFIYLRRRRILASQYATLPTHHRGHHRTLTIATHPTTNSQGNSIFVYDEKMNLIANSSHSPSSSVPEIHVTFPDEEGQTGNKKPGGVFVLCISDSGSVGMKPLHQEVLPPYQSSDAERLQSLDLERIGGLKEKPSTPSNQRWS